VSGPLLDLGQDWQRQRAQLRAAHRRPPPLVTAGLDLVHDSDAPAGRRVQVAGLALVFGLFPASLAEFIDLARSRLRLGGDHVRQELVGVLSARIQALWAWLPGQQCDIYAEVDHATDHLTVWRIGPEEGELSVIDPDRDGPDLDDAFLEALVLNGTRHWGGTAGLQRLVRRFGPHPLLVAAQVADLLERNDADHDTPLAAAQARWSELNTNNESAWESLVDHEHPWACAQLGRLALRLGLHHAARSLLDQIRHAQAGPVVWSDLAQACDLVDDLSGMEAAAAQVVNLTPDETSLRRLVVARVRLGQFTEAGEALVRFRANGGADVLLVDDLLAVLERPMLPLIQRANCAGWLGARTVVALASRKPLDDLLHTIRGDHPETAAAFDQELEVLREALHAVIHADEATTAALRVTLLALPFTARPALRTPSDLAAHALLALRTWAEAGLGAGRVPDTIPVRQALLALARRAVGTSPT
jgi:hypothetical protein